MQDFEWTPRVWFLASRFAYMDENFYCYRQNPHAISHTDKSRHAHDFTICLQLLLSFLKSRQVPEDILAIWGNQWLNIFFWFLFHPVTSRNLPSGERLESLHRLMVPATRHEFRQLVLHSSLSRRLAYPLMLLATHGLQPPVMWYFRKLYYPLVERRERKHMKLQKNGMHG